MDSLIETSAAPGYRIKAQLHDKYFSHNSHNYFMAAERKLALIKINFRLLFQLKKHLATAKSIWRAAGWR